MPKVKMPRSTPSLDMTPMVDLAFLLVTFFMLTSSFRAPEPLLVDPPTSTTDVLIPKQVFLATIDEKGRVFIDITNNNVKIKVLKKLLKSRKLSAMSEEDFKKFAGVGSIGISVKELATFMEMESNERTAYSESAKGIPYDTAESKIGQCELFEWALETRLEAHNDYKEREEEAKLKNMEFDKSNYIQFAIKADGKAPYKVVQSIIAVFREAKVKNFQMITGLESSPIK